MPIHSLSIENISATIGKCVSAVIVFAAGMFRLLTGGAHASSYYRCLASSLIIFNVLGYLFNVCLPWFAGANPLHISLVLLPGFIWVLRYAPISPENKPLKHEKDYLTRTDYF